jgi:hypothetical protein
MTLFNDPIRIIGGRVISLLPTHPPEGRQSGQTGPRRTWELAYQTRPSPVPPRPERAGEGAHH